MSQPEHERDRQRDPLARGSRPRPSCATASPSSRRLSPPAPPSRRERPWRDGAGRWLVPVALAVARLGGARDRSRHLRRRQAGALGRRPGQGQARTTCSSPRRACPFAGPPEADSQALQARKSTGGAGATSGGVPATPGRAQLYESELTLKVRSLSNTTKRALRLTRLYHGYVRSVEYGSGTERGTAYLVAARADRQRAGGDRQVLRARRHPRPARLDRGRAADRRPALPADAGDPRPDRQDPGEAREPGPEHRRAHDARERARRASAASSWSCRSRRRRCRGRRASRPCRLRCARPTRPSSCRTTRTGSSVRSTAPARSCSTRSRSSSTSLIVGAPLLALAFLALRRCAGSGAAGPRSGCSLLLDAPDAHASVLNR